MFFSFFENIVFVIPGERSGCGEPCFRPFGGADCCSRFVNRHRKDRSRKNLHVIPRPVRRLVVGIRNTPAQRSGGTDCHTGDIGHCHRNDTVNASVGADASVRPPTTHRTPGRAHGPCPTKTLVGRDPCAPPHTALLAMCHCEASAHTGCGNPRPPSPRPPCLKGAGTAKPCLGDTSALQE